MEKTKRQLAIEHAYDCEIYELLREKYQADGLSQPELAEELGVPRSTVQHWLREGGIEMRSRTLSDVQRIAAMVLLPYLPNHRIAERVGCSKVTIARYRREIRKTGDPIDVDVDLTENDRALLLPDDASQWVNANTANESESVTTPTTPTDDAGADTTSPAEAPACADGGTETDSSPSEPTTTPTPTPDDGGDETPADQLRSAHQTTISRYF